MPRAESQAELAGFEDQDVVGWEEVVGVKYGTTAYS